MRNRQPASVSNPQKESAADQIDVIEQMALLTEKADTIIKKAQAKGASQVEVGVGKDLGLSVQVRNQDVETLEYNRDNSFGITVYFGQQKGTASTSDLSNDALNDALDAACNIAKYTQADPFSGLADASLMATHKIDLDLDHPMGINADKALELALACEKSGLAGSPKIAQSEGASFSSHRNIRCYANSHGFSAAVPSTRHSMSCVLISKDSIGMQRDYWYSICRDPNQLETAQAIGEHAARRVVARLGGRKLTTRKAPVLMVPEIARGLVGNLCSAIRGSSLYRKSSFLLDSLDKKLFPDFVQFDERPLMPAGLASSWFDNEGLATCDRAIVEQGELKTYLLDSYSARRLKMEPTGHAGGVHNVLVKPQTQNFDQLVKQMNCGLVVTEVMGHGVNLVTGDFSRGAAGFWVENGEIQHFVEEITIAANLKDMFANLVAIGNDLDNRSSIITGSWLLEEMMIAGQ